MIGFWADSFGGDNRERSDIDLAASGGDILSFYYDLEEEAWTLLMFDVVNLDHKISDELRQQPLIVRYCLKKPTHQIREALIKSASKMRAKLNGVI